MIYDLLLYHVLSQYYLQLWRSLTTNNGQTEKIENLLYILSILYWYVKPGSMICFYAKKMGESRG